MITRIKVMNFQWGCNRITLYFVDGGCLNFVKYPNVSIKNSSKILKIRKLPSCTDNRMNVLFFEVVLTWYIFRQCSRGGSPWSRQLRPLGQCCVHHQRAQNSHDRWVSRCLVMLDRADWNCGQKVLMVNLKSLSQLYVLWFYLIKIKGFSAL